MSDKEKSNDIVRSFFLKIRENDSQVNHFFSFLEENNFHHAALGGSVRAAVADDVKVRDIDIVFQGDDTQIYKYLSDNNIPYILNSMKGLKFTIGEIEYDAWNIDNHYAFKKNLLEPKFENIYKTALINYDEMVYDFTTNILYDDGYRKCFDEKMLKLNEDKRFYENNPNLLQYICKIFTIAQKYNISLSEEAIDLIKSQCGTLENIDEFMDSLKAAYKRHYKKDMEDSFYEYIVKQITWLYNN